MKDITCIIRGEVVMPREAGYLARGLNQHAGFIGVSSGVYCNKPRSISGLRICTARLLPMTAVTPANTKANR